MPAPLLINALEVSVTQKTPAARKANFHGAPPGSLVVFIRGSVSGHKESPE